MKDWRELILSDEADLIKGKSKINFEKAQAFQEACEILDRLKAKGILDYEAEDPRKPYYYHTIQVKFNFETEEDQVIDADEVAELLSKVDRLLVAKNSISGEWQLGSQIHSMTD